MKNSRKLGWKSLSDLIKQLKAKAKRRALAEEITQGDVELDAQTILRLTRRGKKRRRLRRPGKKTGDPGEAGRAV
jgi:hypothetical protein